MPVFFYVASECARQESNLRPSGPQPDALSTELRAQIFIASPATLCVAMRAGRPSFFGYFLPKESNWPKAKGSGEAGAERYFQTTNEI